MKLIPGLLLLAGLSLAAVNEPVKQQPVLILIYSRIDDHMHKQSSEERVNRLLANLAAFRQRHPETAVVPVFQFSGAMTDVLAARNNDLHLADKIRDAVKNGEIEIGYHGGNEPTYRNRPRAALPRNASGEQWWNARADAAEKFLTQAKDPVLGTLDPKRPGGLKRVQKEFGPATLVTGTIEYVLGTDASVMHTIRRYNPNFMSLGIPNPDPARDIHGYRGSVVAFSTMLISPLPNTSPEVYWDSDILRTSETTSAEVRTISAAEGPEAIKTLLAKMDRSKIRVIQMEYGSELRYLQTWHDGVPRFHPLVWAYDHPEHPDVPSGVPAFAARMQVDGEYAKEEQTMEWLAKEFFPANPGSRFVNATQLQAMASTPVGKEIDADAIRTAAQDLLKSYDRGNGFAGDLGRAGDQFFSLSDMFQLLAKSFAGMKNGQLPDKVKVSSIFGPMDMPADLGQVVENISAASVMKTASLIAPRLQDAAAWKPVPTNTIPTWITVDGKRLNASQFLRLMAEIYLDPNPARKLNARRCELFSSLGAAFPHNVSRNEQGNTWTFRPAVLKLASTR